MDEVRRCWIELDGSSSSLLALILAMAGETYEIIGLSFEGNKEGLEKIEKICDYFKVVIPIYSHREDLEEDYFQSGSLRALEICIEDFGSVDFLNFGDLDFLGEFTGELGDVFLTLDEKTKFILGGELAHKDPKIINRILKTGQIYILKKEAVESSNINGERIYNSLTKKTKSLLESLDLVHSFNKDIHSINLKLLQSYIYRKSIIYQEKQGKFSEDNEKYGIFEEGDGPIFYLGVQGNEDFFEEFLGDFL